MIGHEIIGDDMPAVVITMGAGDEVTRDLGGTLGAIGDLIGGDR